MHRILTQQGFKTTHRCCGRVGRCSGFGGTSRTLVTTSNNNSNTTIGTIKRRTNTNHNQHTPPKYNLGEAPPGSPEAELEIMNSSITKEVTGEVKRNNVVLAMALVGFCAGVMWYSMHAVGQSAGGEDDPLLALKEEAAEAQAARDKESRTQEEATAMLKEFQKGSYDPDAEDYEDEENLEKSTKKKPWWKVW
jgi:hypothetical protein